MVFNSIFFRTVILIKISTVPFPFPRLCSCCIPSFSETAAAQATAAMPCLPQTTGERPRRLVFIVRLAPMSGGAWTVSQREGKNAAKLPHQILFNLLDLTVRYFVRAPQFIHLPLPLTAFHRVVWQPCLYYIFKFSNKISHYTTEYIFAPGTRAVGRFHTILEAARYKLAECMQSLKFYRMYCMG